MKKTNLLIAAAALMVVGCAENKMFNDIEQDEVLIGFGESYIGKKTKAGEISNKTDLEKNGNTMEVWGWKTTSSSTTQVFNNQQVTYNSSSSQSTTKWEYSPLKYWDLNASNYKFYAVSPYSNKFSITSDTRLISATGIETVQILEDNNGTSQVTSSTAIDYLVAEVVDKAPKGNDASDYDVAFTFQHILSKLAVKVKTKDEFNNSGSNYPQIKLNSLSIKLAGMCPNFTQKTTGNLTPNATSGDTWNGTAMSETAYTCFNADGTTVTNLVLTNSAQGIASYLVAPTATGETPATHTFKVSVDYDIYYSADEHENFVATDKTVTTLTSFVQNTNNTLTVTIGPTAIYFDVETVDGRTTGSEGTVTIE